ncbi:hypothetical protein GCM10010873_09880 [Cypionkella aquatica]|uniref:Uncharacterized protein n=1 Tax=Cypionkella aquatica TaxID=1756042 RepID=A0AA37WZS5_9RHOB|nr:hypothetical protein GCM10010873_09880 [Cypionkella aquatica]
MSGEEKNYLNIKKYRPENRNASDLLKITSFINKINDYQLPCPTPFSAKKNRIISADASGPVESA